MQIMNYSSTFETHMRNPVWFQESHQEHVFRLTGSPRGNVFLGASMRRVRIMRAALRHRLNVHKSLSPGELRVIMHASNCPFWLSEKSVEELMDTLAVKLEGSTFMPSSSIRHRPSLNRAHPLPVGAEKATSHIYMEEQSAQEGRHAKGSPMVLRFRYE